MKNVKLTIAYDGTAYHGWQSQPRDVTVQDTLRKAIETVSGGLPVRLTGGGRTDAGVHALGQVANFLTGKPFSEVKWVSSINALLPDDIAVMRADFVPEHFHARFSAVRKSYLYKIGRIRFPFRVNREWLYPYPLNVPAMKRAIRYLLGKHDFTSFASALSESDTKVCHLFGAEIIREDGIIIRLTADRFLTHMVRAIVGTLVEVGSGKIVPSEVKRILLQLDRKAAGRTAPPEGLYLEKIIYPETVS